MNDMEMTRRVAVKLDLPNISAFAGSVTYLNANSGWPRVYDPLHNDSQALALVKRFHMSVTCHQDDIGGYDYCATCGPHQAFVAHDLNRAIVQCAVKLFEDEKIAA